MKISGFTIVRNAEIMGYPALESIKSALPLVDEFVVGLGPCEDNTEQMILELQSPKIRIFHADWNTNHLSGGQVLSAKTNEALAQCKNNLCLYLQADEVLHEQDYSTILETVQKYENDKRVEGFLFKYIHFYSSYQVIATSRKWYRNEVRIVKKDLGLQSWGDAQGFRISGQKPKVCQMSAHIYHYGWVKPPKQMGEKKKRLDQLWHGNKKDKENDQFNFKRSYGLQKFNGTHPSVMKDKVRMQNWDFDYRMKIKDWTLQDFNCLASDVLEKVFSYRIGEYKNYRLIR